MVRPEPVEETTQLLLALRDGDRRSLDRLVGHLYDELHAIARRELVRFGFGGTLRTTGLVHGAYVKLVDASRLEVGDRAHFYALAATVMRRIVIDHARRRRTLKRGGDVRRVPFDDVALVSHERLDELIDLDEALTRLERFDPQLSKVVECRFFAGMSIKETAEALEVSPSTVDRAWLKAKAWLSREIDATQ